MLVPVKVKLLSVQVNLCLLIYVLSTHDSIMQVSECLHIGLQFESFIIKTHHYIHLNTGDRLDLVDWDRFVF